MRRLCLYPVLSVAIWGALSTQTVCELHFEHLNARLLNGEIRHLDIQAMEVDTAKTLVYGLGQLAFAYLFNAFLVVKGAELVELAVELVEFCDGARVLDVGWPEATWEWAVLSLELLNDCIEIPREC